MFEYFLKALGVLFIAMGPIDNAAIFAGLGHNYTKKELKDMAFRACLIATIVILAFAFGGSYILKLIGVQIYSLQVGGGILLLLLSIQIVMNEYESGSDLASQHKNKDLAIFPLAIPLIAGPAVITLTTEMLANASGDFVKQSMVVCALMIHIVLSYILFRLAGLITKLLGAKGGEILARVLGILLAIIAADLILNGIRSSGAFN